MTDRLDRPTAPRSTVSRRAFLRSTATAVAAWAGPLTFGIAASPSRHTVHGAQLLLKGALLYDGTGAAPVEGDVAVAGDRIGAVGRRLRAPGAQVVDLSGLALAPGFIDIHSHTDLELLIDPRAESKIRQGVTTEIVGQDGASIGPWRKERAEEMHERYHAQYDVDLGFNDLDGFLHELVQRHMAVNIASMIGHGTVRDYVIGNDNRPTTSAELERMTELVGDAIRQGAVGLSSGLEYVPGAFADLDELTALATALRGTGLPYASHLRNEDDELFAAVEEALNVGRRAGVPVHISHLKAQGRRNWWKAEPVLHALEAARADGVHVTYDRYPYVAYSTGLASLFPVWSREGGTEAFLTRLQNPELAARIDEDVRRKIDRLGSWNAVQITSTTSDDLAWAEGGRLGTLAAQRNMEPYALLLHITKEDRNRSGMVGFGMSEENTARFLAHPLGMSCSDGSALATDGPLSHGTPHPRNFGTYPRILGHYCRDERLMPLETAIHKMTAMPARRLRLEPRGTITQGGFADLVAFDPDNVADKATFENPHRYPVGIRHVLVNGRFVVRDSDHTGALPGRVLRPTV